MIVKLTLYWDRNRNGQGIILTDLVIHLFGFRSSLAYKKFIDLGAGVVDYDYRGNVGVVIFNHFKEPFVVKKGDRIAQLVVEKIAMPALIEVQVSFHFPFASSGVLSLQHITLFSMSQKFLCLYTVIGGRVFELVSRKGNI